MYQTPNGHLTIGEQFSMQPFWRHERPAMAGGRNLCLIAYEDEPSDPTGDRHVYGKLAAPYSLALLLVLHNH